MSLTHIIRLTLLNILMYIIKNGSILYCISTVTVWLQESVFVMAVMSLTILGPSGWILTKIEDYKTQRG
uniref:Uncharacterized protein n=1 Tax=Gouania willdenowi TaxID=441366 RepID=A0A8C5DDM9_GOUWI